VTDKKDSGASLSAVVVIPDVYETLKKTMGYLKAQTAADKIEIVFVGPSNQRESIDLSDLANFHSWQFIGIPSVINIARSYCVGIRSARSPIVILAEDHAFPEAHWAELLIKDHEEDWAVVGPSMRNANPESLVSRADFYQAYGAWAYPTKRRAMESLPAHNSSYKRSILMQFDNQLEDFMEAEYLLHRLLRSKGYKLLLEGGTYTAHVNFVSTFSSWSYWFTKRFYAGRQYASTWSRSWTLARRIMFVLATPLIPFIRLWRILRPVCRLEKPVNWLLIIPIMLSGLIAESCGHMFGYIGGAGDWLGNLPRYEFHRE
jgi:hypothetical protein